MAYRDEGDREAEAQRRLGKLRVAAPCGASWDGMVGDARARRCALCEKNVYDLSAMTAIEALELLASRGEPTCVRLYRRADGTVLTSDCDVGRRRRRRKVALAVAGAAAAAAVSLLPGPPRGPTVERAAPPEAQEPEFAFDEEAYLRRWEPDRELESPPPSASPQWIMGQVVPVVEMGSYPPGGDDVEERAARLAEALADDVFEP